MLSPKGECRHSLGGETTKGEGSVYFSGSYETSYVKHSHIFVITWFNTRGTSPTPAVILKLPCSLKFPCLDSDSLLPSLTGAWPVVPQLSLSVIGNVPVQCSQEVSLLLTARFMSVEAEVHCRNFEKFWKVTKKKMHGTIIVSPVYCATVNSLVT